MPTLVLGCETKEPHWPARCSQPESKRDAGKHGAGVQCVYCWERDRLWL